MKAFLDRLFLFVHEIALLPSRLHAAVFMVSVFVSSQALAAGGVTGFLTGWMSGIRTFIDVVILIGMALGIAGVLYGLINMIKKGMGRGEDMEWSKIMWPILGGGLATVLLFVVQVIIEEGGASRSDMGRGN